VADTGCTKQPGFSFPKLKPNRAMTLINRVLAFNIVWVGAMAQKYLMKISDARSLLGIFTGFFV